MTASGLYRGLVVHRRLKPRRHRMVYRVFTLLLDLDELPALDRSLTLFGHNRRALLSFHDRDHGPGDGSPLKPWVVQRLAEAGIELDGGPVRLLCYPRVLGLVFNPLTVYFCHRPDGALAAVLYEVNNTFGQRHCYLIPVNGDGDGLVRQSCPKGFFVSPFLPMDLTYHFRIQPPGEQVAVAIHETDAEGAILHAAFTGRRQPLTDRSLLAAWIAHPLLTAKVVAGIHWEALWLWAKGLRLHRRPPPPAQLVTVVPPPVAQPEV